MYLLKQSLAAFIPVIIVNSSGVGIAGIAYNDPLITNVRVQKPGLAFVSKTLAAPDWVDCGGGVYNVQLSASELNTVGVGTFSMQYNGDQGDYPFNVRANTEAEVITAVSGLLAVIRGLMGADSYEDTFAYSGPGGAISSSRLRTYNSAANATTHGATGLLKTYTLTFSYTGTDLTGVLITEA